MTNTAVLRETWKCEITLFNGEYLRAVTDQGSRGTCLAHAATAAHEVARGDGRALCSEYIFWAARQIDGLAQDGNSPHAMVMALKIEGQPEEIAWPYCAERDTNSPNYQPPTRTYEIYRRNARLLPPDINELPPIINRGGAPVIGIALTRDFFGAHDGLLPVRSSVRRIEGYHGIVIVGCATTRDGYAAYIVRNSWGDEWGAGGYALLPHEYLNARLTCVIELLEEVA